jgi:hypothetical protein
MRSDNYFFAFWMVIYFLYFLFSYLPFLFAILCLVSLLFLLPKPNFTLSTLTSIARSTVLFYTFLAFILTLMQFPALGLINLLVVAPFFLLLLAGLIFWDLRSYLQKGAKKDRPLITRSYFRNVLSIMVLELVMALILKNTGLTDFSDLYKPELIVDHLLAPFRFLLTRF